MRIGLGHPPSSGVDGVNDELVLAVTDCHVGIGNRLLFVAILNVGDVLRIDKAGISIERILAPDLVRDQAVLRGVLLPSVSESRAFESLQCAEMLWKSTQISWNVERLRNIECERELMNTDFCWEAIRMTYSPSINSISASSDFTIISILVDLS